MPPRGIGVGLYKRDAELTTKEEGLRNSMEIAIKFKKNNLIMVCVLVWAERNPDKTPYDCATEFLNKGCAHLIAVPSPYDLEPPSGKPWHAMLCLGDDSYRESLRKAGISDEENMARLKNAYFFEKQGLLHTEQDEEEIDHETRNVVENLRSVYRDLQSGDYVLTLVMIPEEKE